MNTNILISSVVRWLLTALGAWLVSKGFIEEGTALETTSVFEIILGSVSMLIAFALKKAEAIGGAGALAAKLIGPRVKSITASISRFIIASVAGFSSAYIGMGETELANSDIVSVIVLIAGLVIDVLLKKLKP